MSFIERLKRVNEIYGMVVSGKNREGKVVFVVGGEVFQNEDGTINREASDKELYVKYSAEDSEPRLVSLNDITEVSRYQANELKLHFERQIDAALKSQDEMEGQEPPIGISENVEIQEVDGTITKGLVTRLIPNDNGQVDYEVRTGGRADGKTAVYPASMLRREGAGDVIGDVEDNANKPIDYSTIKPIGRGVFGNIYDQFKGKAKQAVEFLLSKKEGEAIGVFYKESLGDIDLPYGSHIDKYGLEHIIEKHIKEQNDFNSVDEAVSIINEVIENGEIKRENDNKVIIDKDGYRVVVNKNVRDDRGNIINTKNWIVTGFDTTRSANEKASSRKTLTTPLSNQQADGVTLPTNDASDAKVQKNTDTNDVVEEIPPTAQELSPFEEYAKYAEVDEEAAKELMREKAKELKRKVSGLRKSKSTTSDEMFAKIREIKRLEGLAKEYEDLASDANIEERVGSYRERRAEALSIAPADLPLRSAIAQYLLGGKINTEDFKREFGFKGNSAEFRYYLRFLSNKAPRIDAIEEQVLGDRSQEEIDMISGDLNRFRNELLDVLSEVGKNGRQSESLVDMVLAGVGKDFKEAERAYMEEVKYKEELVVTELMRSGYSREEALNLLRKGKAVEESTEDVDDLFGAEERIEDAPFSKLITNDELRIANERFNLELESMTEENADSKYLDLGRPSSILQSVGVVSNPLRLHGSKVAKKAKKHGFNFSDIKDLPKAVASPVAVFKGAKEGTFAILTELRLKDKNVLVSLGIGKGSDIDFNVISSVYGKSEIGVLHWIKEGKTLYVNKEKALNYLHLSAPVAEASNKEELNSITKVVKEFENPKIGAIKVVGEVQQVIDEIQAKSNGAAKVKFVRTEGLPNDVKQQDNFDSRLWNGVMYGDVIYMHPDRVVTREQAIAKWVHEVGVHFGIHSLIPNKALRDNLMQRVWDSAKELAESDKGLGAIVSHIKKHYKEPIKGKDTVKGEEVLAYLSEYIITGKALSPAEQTLWERILDLFRDALAKVYGVDKSLFTEKDLGAIIYASIQTNFQNNEYKSNNERGSREVRHSKELDADGGKERIDESRGQNSLEYGQQSTDTGRGGVLSTVGESARVGSSKEKASSKILTAFKDAVSGKLKGKPIEVGRLTQQGREYLQELSGLTFKENISFVLNPSDLVHIYNDHYGNNEKDKGNNIPLTDADIENMADVISNPDKILSFKQDGINKFMFLKEDVKDKGTYNLMEVFSNKRGNLTAKSLYKTRKDVTSRAMTILKQSKLSTSKTSRAILSETKVPVLFEDTKLGNENVRFSKVPQAKDYENAVDFAKAQLAYSRNAKNLEIAMAEAEVDTQPTEKQKEAGNYKKGHVKVQGLDISIEQPKGSVRSGVDKDGKEWSVTMNNTYGYFKGTKGRDGDHIDTFLGDNLESDKVFVIDQVDDKGKFDEHKVMLGFNTEQEAKEAYLSNYSEGWQGLGAITEMNIDELKEWTKTDGKRVKPVSELVRFSKESDKQELDEIKVQAEKNGTFMKAPNGKPTNLNERQWLQVRTKAFKEWFGDWENARLIGIAQDVWNGNRTPSKAVIVASEKLQTKAKEVFGHKVDKVVITDSDIRHIKNNHGQNEESRGQVDITPEDIAVIPYVMNNFDTATENRTDKKGNKTIQFTKRVNGTTYVIGIEKGKDKAFVVTSWTKKKSDVSMQSDNDQPPKPNAQSDSDLAKVVKEVESIKQSYENSSKVVDENGEPLVVYHGSRNGEFYEFSNDKVNPNLNGFYFSNSKEFAKKFAGNNGYLFETFIDIKNPNIDGFDGTGVGAVMSNFDYRDGGIFTKRQTDKYAEKGIKEYVVGSPFQIKSATDNVGTFDGENGDIRFSKSITNEELRIANEEFNSDLDRLKEGTLPRGHIFQLGRPMEILQSAGMPNLPIELTAKKLKEKSVQKEHLFELSEVKDLPKAVQEPMAVFNSSTMKGRKVVFTELTHNDKNFVVALELNYNKGKISVNDVRSIYPRNNTQIVRSISNNEAVYLDKEKMLEWIGRQQFNSAEATKNSNISTNIIENFENPKLQNDDIRFSIIGEKGAKELDRAEERAHRMDNLQVAREMETANKDVKAIRLATGWERGADGRWRYEILDGKLKNEIRIKEVQSNSKFNHTVVDSVDYEINDEGTFKIRLRGKGAKSLDDFLHYSSLRKSELETFLGKEIAQDILSQKGEKQDHNLDLDEGTSYEINKEYKNIKAENGIKLVEMLDNPALFKAYPNLRDIPVFFSNDRGGAYIEDKAGNPYIRLNNNAASYSLKSVLSHEIQHAIQGIEGFERGGNLFSFMDKETAIEVEKVAKEIKKAIDLKNSGKWIYEVSTLEEIITDGEIPNKVKEWAVSIVKEGEKSINEFLKSTPSEMYKRLSGETEARNVEKRLGMTEEQRRNTLLSETEDVAREDQIFLRGNAAFSKSIKNEELRIKNEELNIKNEELRIKNENILIAPDEGNVRFSKADLNEVNNTFNTELDELKDGTLVKGHIFQLGRPMEILQSAGMPNLPIELSADRLKRKSEQENHPFDLTNIVNLPQAIQEPIMVFDSKTVSATNVVLTELSDGEKNFVVVLRVSHKGAGRNNIQVNDIKSLYPKDGKQIIKWIEQGDLLKYVNKEKATEFISVQSTNLIGNGNKSSNFSIAKIIENFENPKSDEVRFSKFVKRNYTEQQAKRKEEEIKRYFEENLRDGFSLDRITSSLTNGLSVYATVSYDKAKDKLRPFVFRISDHENGYKDERVANTGVSWQVQGTDLNAMYRFYGLLTDRELKEEDNKSFVDLHRRLVATSEAEGRTDSVAYRRSLAVIKKFEEADDKSNIRFSKSTNNDELGIANERFNLELDRFTKGAMKSNEVLHLGKPMDILRSVGIDTDDIYVKQSTLKAKIAKHGFTANDLKGLAGAIQMPIMVYDWGSKAKQLTLLTGHKIKGQNVIIAFNALLGVENMEIKEIRTIFPKDVNRFIDELDVHQFANDLKYVNKEKALEWLGSVPTKGEQPTTKKGFSIANIVKEFENPKLSVGEVRFSKGGKLGTPEWLEIGQRELERMRLEKELASEYNKKERWLERIADKFRPVERLQGKVEKALGEELPYGENAYKAEMMRTSIGNRQLEVFQREYYNPLVGSIGKLLDDSGSEYNDVVMYMMSKHAIERNAYMQEHKGVENGSGIETSEAERIVREFEDKVNDKGLLADFWAKIKRATDYSLDIQLDSGLLGRDLYKHIKGMYDYYVPLRGWSADTVGDVFDVMHQPLGKGALQRVKEAKGRSSLADDPIPYIVSMAEGAILSGGKNKVRQAMLRMARNHPEPELYQVGATWFV